ncbi:MAG: cytochrome P460 family protein [Bacteroidetes bacterium]|nr:cytochrome P460 family protein [Bacteroidota bacterium]
MKNLNIILSSLLILSISISACKKDDDDEKEANTNLFVEINRDVANYYIGTPDIVEGNGNVHGFIKVRYNTIAAAALDSTGKLPIDSVFPKGSVVVKEIYSSINGGFIQFAVMKKDPGNKYAGAGWLWGEYKSGGEVTFSVAKKGNGCISCHSLPDNRDLNRVLICIESWIRMY